MRKTRISYGLNIILLLMVVVLLLNKYGILTRTAIFGFRYQDNPVYEAYESMFELNPT